MWLLCKWPVSLSLSLRKNNREVVRDLLEAVSALSKAGAKPLSLSVVIYAFVQFTLLRGSSP